MPNVSDPAKQTALAHLPSNNAGTLTVTIDLMNKKALAANR